MCVCDAGVSVMHWVISSTIVPILALALYTMCVGTDKHVVMNLIKLLSIGMWLIITHSTNPFQISTSPFQSCEIIL